MSREHQGSITRQFETDDPAKRDRDPKEAGEGCRFAEDHDADDDRANGADAGPDRIGRAERQHLKRLAKSVDECGE